jgi:hypothetical protein
MKTDRLLKWFLTMRFAISFDLFRSTRSLPAGLVWAGSGFRLIDLNKYDAAMSIVRAIQADPTPESLRQSRRQSRKVLMEENWRLFRTRSSQTFIERQRVVEVGDAIFIGVVTGLQVVGRVGKTLRQRLEM